MWRITPLLLVGALTFPLQAEPLNFEQHVRPILKAYCLDCHGGGEKLSGSLDLRLKRFALTGGDSGPALDLKSPASSLLIARMKSGEMPPGEKKVPSEQIAKIEEWVKQGAVTTRVEPAKLPVGIDITPEERAYWFYQPLKRPTAPELPGVTSTTDRFILAKLQTLGLQLAPEADRRTLIRRVTLDLTGLPPTPEQVDAFVADTTPDAYAKLLDRLLASPAYGERWARHWLDIAGYADSEGDNNTDTTRPFAYKYRDYVIRAFNSDMPFDHFVIEQLAGDELVPQPWKNLSPENIDRLVATGFLRMGPDPTASDGNNMALRHETVGNTLKIVSTSLLGLSVGCAQCHDHRYDPIPQSDYFRFRAIFEPALDPANWRISRERVLSLYTDADRAKAVEVSAKVAEMEKAFAAKQTLYIANAIDKELLKYEEPLRAQLREAQKTPADKRTPQQIKLMETHPNLNINAGILYQYNMAASDELTRDRQGIAVVQAQRPHEDFIAYTGEVSGVVPKTFLFYRGDYRAPKQVLLPGDLTIASPDGSQVSFAENAPQQPSTGRRLAYARHLMSGSHPLVGRVLANRVWLNHFGRGIVSTPAEFGVLGTKPTHPELLDYLATEFAQSGWSMKHLHRIIMMSQTYRQSSTLTVANQADRDNQWYSRYPLHRLEAEAIRDRMLAVSGQLDDRAFGASVPVAEDFVGQVIPENNSPRRSVYLQVRRSKPVSFLSTFDSASTELNCDRRQSSTSAPQALTLMNSDFVRKQSDALARRLRAVSPTIEGQLQALWQVAYLRSITPDEQAMALRFLQQQTSNLNGQPNPDYLAFVNLCQQLLCSNEFLYVD